ncbi:MAG: hypothetical protein SangKO_035020 [Sandaracinaceae bacterium]
MRPSVGYLLFALVALSSGCRETEPPSRVDAGQRAVDAGVAEDAGPPPDAGWVPDAGPPPPRDPAETLGAEIRGLQALLAGQLPADLDPQTLFEVDLLDDAARLSRVEALRASIAAREAPAPVPDAGLAPPDAAPPDGALADAAVAAGDETNVVPAADAGDAGIGDAGPTPDAGLATTEPEDVAEGEALTALRLQRDRLRLQFLTLPSEERAAVFDAVRTRRRISAEQEASRAEEQRADEEALRASAARREALDRAAVTVSAIERDLLAERARVETAREELAQWQARLARERQAVALRSAERLQHVHTLDRALSRGRLDEDDADDRYHELVLLLRRDRWRLDQALDAIGTPSAAPTYEPAIDLGEPIYHGFEARERLREAIDALEAHALEAEETERRVRWERASRIAEDVRQLDELRIRLLPRMSRRTRETMLGLGPEGRAQLGRELNQIRLMGRFWGLRTWHDLPQIPAQIGAMLALSSTRTELLLLFAIGALIVVTWRRKEALTERLRKALHARTQQRQWTALVRPFWVVIGPLIAPLIVVVLLHVVFGVLDGLTDSMFVDGLRVVVLGFAWLIVAITATARLFVSRLRHGAGRAVLSRRIFTSVRMVLGFAFVAVTILRLSELLVGRGYLYTIVVDLAWLGVIPLFAILVHRWADDVVNAHADRYPEGFVATRLTDPPSRLRRYILTPPAAAQLAYVGATTAFKELALRFEQSRRAFAFLFRRRLEKQGEGARPEKEISDLPEDIREAFEEVPGESELEIGHFPELDQIAGQIAAWSDGAPGFAVALIGERGIGKTTWMRQLAARTEIAAEIIDVPDGLTEPEQVTRWASEVLGVDTCATVDELDTKVKEATAKRLVLLDHCQNFVLRAIGGMRALETMVEITARTSANIVWVCAFSRYTWLYLERARQAQDLFSARVELGAWPEEKIAALIRKRMETLNRQASFRDLVVDRLAGSALEDAVLRTESEYLRLLWDYSVGNPRVAMHYWKHSLSVDDEKLRVQLFRAPEVEALEELHEQSRFLLAAVALHENVTEEEAALTTGIDRRQCAAILAFLAGRRYVECDANGAWRITTHWYRAIIRYLRRKRLLFD